MLNSKLIVLYYCFDVCLCFTQKSVGISSQCLFAFGSFVISHYESFFQHGVINQLTDGGLFGVGLQMPQRASLGTQKVLSAKYSSASSSSAYSSACSFTPLQLIQLTKPHHCIGTYKEKVAYQLTGEQFFFAKKLCFGCFL